MITLKTFLPRSLTKTVLLAGAIFATSITANTVSALSAEFSDLEKDEIQRVIRNYIEENPGLIMESFERFRTQQEVEKQKQATLKIAEYQDYFDSPSVPHVGSENPKVTVVEFFDYNCGYCKRALPDVQISLKKNDDVKFVFMEMPILAESSKVAAQWAEAAHKQGKYFEFHTALMEKPSAKDEILFKKIAKEVGLNFDQLKKDANSDSVKDAIEKSMQIARDIGISGTPAFIINGKLYPGYLGKDRMTKAIEEARESGVN